MLDFFETERSTPVVTKWSRVIGPTRSIPLQVTRAILASAVSASLDVATLVLLVETGALKPESSAIIAYLFGGAANYAL